MGLQILKNKSRLYFLSAFIALSTAAIYIIATSSVTSARLSATGAIAIALFHAIRYEPSVLTLLRKISTEYILIPIFLMCLAFIIGTNLVIPEPSLIRIYTTVAFTVALVAGVAICWRSRDHIFSAILEERTARISHTAKIILFTLLFLLTAYAFWLRVAPSSEGFFHVDEAISGLAAHAVVETGAPTMPSGRVYSREPLSTYLISLGIWEFGFTEFGTRFADVVAGTVTVVCLYAIGTLLISRRSGLVAALLASLSLSMVQYSNFARMYAFLTLFLNLTVLCTLLYLRKPTVLRLLLVVLSAFFAFLSHRIGFLACLLPLGAVLTVYAPIFPRFYKTNKRAAVAVLVLVIALLAVCTSALVNLFVRYVYQNKASFDFSSVFTEIGRSYLIIGSNIGVVGIFTIIGLLGLTYYLWRAAQWKQAALIAFLVICIPLVIDMAIYSQSFGVGYRDRYIFFVFPYFIFLTALGMVFVGASVKWGRMLVPFFILFTLLAPGFIATPVQPELSSTEREIFTTHIKDVLASKPFVLAGGPPELLTFYFREPDYWLVSHPGEILLYGRDGKYQYINAQVLDTLEKLITLEQSGKSVMIILERSRWQFVNRDVKEHIEQKYTQDKYPQSTFDVFILDIP